MSTFYNNLPQNNPNSDSSQQTLKLFDAYTNQPITIDAATYDSMVGFFESRGFLKDSAQSTALIIIRQAKLDNINPYQLLDTLSGLESVQLNNLITELLNYNRYKSSSLGMASPFTPNQDVARNIIA